MLSYIHIRTQWDPRISGLTWEDTEGRDMAKEILVCLDGSHFSEQTLPQVFREASPPGSRVTLFHILVRDLPLFVMPSPHPVRFLPYEVLTCELEERRELVSSRLGRTRSSLIVTAAQGYRGLDGWLRGSITQSGIRESPVPVLVIRPQPDRVSSTTPSGSLRNASPSAN